MSSAGALVPPEQTIEYNAELAWRYWQQLVGLLSGQSDWGAPIVHSSYGSDVTAAHTTKQNGTAPIQEHRDSGGNLIFQSSAGGVNVTGLSASGNIGVTGNLSATNVSASANVSGATGSFTGAVGVASLSATTTVQGTRFISTVSTGTAPLTVSSTTVVTNLNADLVDGIHGTALVLKAGDTMTGQLTIQANQGLKLQNTSGGGIISFNATNVADPVLEIKDNSGDNIILFNPSGSTYGIDVNPGTVSTNAARFTGDVLITGGLGTTGGIAPGAASGTPAAQTLYSQSFAKAWGNISGVSASTNQIFNISSISDGGASGHTVTIDRDFANTAYVPVVTALYTPGGTATTTVTVTAVISSASAFIIYCQDVSTGAHVDPTAYAFVCFGAQ